MNEQSVMAAIAMALSAINVWGIFILSGISRKFEAINVKLDNAMLREEANDRFREHADADGRMFDRERDARHKLANDVTARLLDHERRLTVFEERVENLRQGRRSSDGS